MTHITISDRIIALPVEKDGKDHTLINGVLWWNHEKGMDGIALTSLPPDKTYKFLCLASEVHKNPEIYYGDAKLILLKPDKEYALIEVE